MKLGREQHAIGAEIPLPVGEGVWIWELPRFKICYVSLLCQFCNNLTLLNFSVRFKLVTVYDADVYTMLLSSF